MFIKDSTVQFVRFPWQTFTNYLINEGYLDYFDENELELIALDPELQFIKNLILVLDPLFRGKEFLADNCVVRIERLAQNGDIKSLLQKVIIELMNTKSDNIIVEIISYQLYKYLESRDLKKLFRRSLNSIFFDNLKLILFVSKGNYSKNLPYIFSMLILFFADVDRRIGKEAMFELIDSFQEAHKISFKLKLSRFLEGFPNLTIIDNLKEDTINIEDFVIEIINLI
ncbi:hypothetical protein LCGC14_1397190 [marine sediment metagenome]|uniref:Uncharacterized protein n=1 Tax=marine sediment metagenome TaxID=412755 RepID=A0A0F9JY82_9ZZZZ|nr:hypothetical protein [bacterium]